MSQTDYRYWTLLRRTLVLFDLYGGKENKRLKIRSIRKCQTNTKTCSHFVTVKNS